MQQVIDRPVEQQDEPVVDEPTALTTHEQDALLIIAGGNEKVATVKAPSNRSGLSRGWQLSGNVD